jgi:hypothetical protein
MTTDQFSDDARAELNDMLRGQRTSERAQALARRFGLQPPADTEDDDSTDDDQQPS